MGDFEAVEIESVLAPSERPSEGWAEPTDLVSSLEDFKAHVKEDLRGAVTDGPVGYLQSKLASMEQRKEFADYLVRALPEKMDVGYTYGEITPVPEAEMGNALPVAMHVAMLGFEPDCTLKTVPGHGSFTELIDQFLMDGFVTSSEPLLVVFSRDPERFAGNPIPWDQGGPGILPAFSVGYLKGMSRAASVMALLHRAFVNKWDLQSSHPVLYESLRVVYVQHMELPNKFEEGLKNMKLSARGSLRKANSVVQTVAIIRNLTKCGMMRDSASFVRRWNSMATRNQQIVGKKATSLRLLLECAPTAPRLIKLF